MRKLSVNMNSRHPRTIRNATVGRKKAAWSILREIPETTHARAISSWLRKADLKIQTEAFICAAQEQALRTNYESAMRSGSRFH